MSLYKIIYFTSSLLQNFKGRFLDFPMYHNFAIFSELSESSFYKEESNISKITELKVLNKSFCGGFLNSAAHTS